MDIYGAPPAGITGDFYGGHPMGVLAEDVPSTGLSGAGYLYAGLSFPADTGKRVRGVITRWPTLGTFTPNVDSSFDYLGATDYALFCVYTDGVASSTDVGYGAGIGRIELLVGVVTATLGGAITLANMVAAGRVAGYSTDIPLDRPVFSVSIGSAGIRIGASSPAPGAVRIGQLAPDKPAAG